MQTGVIKIVDYVRGLGYIKQPNGEEIVLITLGLEDKIAAGVPVRYNVQHTRRGHIAVNVQPIVQ
jgi:cold shock CspA family protein